MAKISIFSLLALNGHFNSMKPGFRTRCHLELSFVDILSEFHDMSIYTGVTPGGQSGMGGQIWLKYTCNIGFAHVIHINIAQSPLYIQYAFDLIKEIAAEVRFSNSLALMMSNSWGPALQIWAPIFKILIIIQKLPYLCI